MDSGLDFVTKRTRGPREKQPLQKLFQQASSLISAKFREQDFSGVAYNQHDELKDPCTNQTCPICADEVMQKHKLTCNSIACLSAETEEGVAAHLLLVELIGLRLYTGPMFERKRPVNFHHTTLFGFLC